MKVEPPQVEPKGWGNNVLQTEDLEKQAFAIEDMYQTRREHWVEHITPLVMMVGIKVWQVNRVNVLHTSESKISLRHQH